MELEQAVEVLAKATDKDEVLKLLQAKAGSIHHAVFQKGHDVGYGKKSGELTEAQTKLAALESAVSERDAKLAELQKAGNDVGKIHQQYQDEIKRITQTHEAEKKALRGGIQEERRHNALATLRSVLTGSQFNVDPDFAQVLTERPDIRDRIKPGEDGSITVLQAGKDIPIAATDGRTPLQVLAEEVTKGVDPKWIRSGADRGSGSSPGGQLPTGGASNLFKQIREAKQKELDAKKAEAEAARKNLAALGVTPSA